MGGGGGGGQGVQPGVRPGHPDSQPKSEIAESRVRELGGGGLGCGFCAGSEPEPGVLPSLFVDMGSLPLHVSYHHLINTHSNQPLNPNGTYLRPASRKCMRSDCHGPARLGQTSAAPCEIDGPPLTWIPPCEVDRLIGPCEGPCEVDRPLRIAAQRLRDSESRRDRLRDSACKSTKKRDSCGL